MPPSAPHTSTDVIVVSGVGTAAVDVTVAELSVGLEASADSPGAALSLVTEASTRVLAAAADRGIPNGDVRTQDVSVRADYHHPEPRVTGYTANHGLVLRFTDIPGAPAVIDAVARAAGDALRLGGFSLSAGDTTAARAQAGVNAVAAARERAGQLAEAAGVRVGPVVSIVELPGGWDRPVARPLGLAMAAESADAGVPVRAGTDVVTAQVTVTFRLQS